MRLDPRLRVAAIGGILLMAFLVVNAFVSERNLQGIIDASNQSRRTREVLTALDNTWSALQDAERSQRGYLLTGSAQYLRPYTEAPAILDRRIAELERLWQNEPAQLGNIQNLKKLIDAKLTEIARTIQLYDRGDRVGAVNLVREHVGFRRMQAIRDSIEKIRSEENRILTERRADIQAKWDRARATINIATALGLALLGLVAIAFVRQSNQARLLAEQRRDSEAKFQEMADSLPLMAWSFSPDGALSFANRYFFTFTGVGPSADLTHTLRSSLLEQDRPSFEQLVAAAQDGHPNVAVDLRFTRADGETRIFETRCVPFHNKHGRPIGWFGSAIDVTDSRLEQERLSRAVSQRTAELSEANRELEGFTYSVSHDLRSPLRALASTSRILLEDYGDVLPEAGKVLLGRQAAAATKLGQLIDDLLHLARISRHEMQHQEIDLSSLVADIVSQLPDHGERFRFIVHPSLQTMGDPRLLRLMLENLISNAVKFSPNGGSIEFGIRETTRGLAFFVADQGVGFDMEYSHKLFKPFERLVHESEFPGTGIGLTNVQRIVHRHRGEVWAESSPGKGATFYFTLGEMPVAHPDERAAMI